MIKITRNTLSDWQRWPKNPTRILFPTVAVQGFGPFIVIAAFWKWRFSFKVTLGKEASQ